MGAYSIISCAALRILATRFSSWATWRTTHWDAALSSGGPCCGYSARMFRSGRGSKYSTATARMRTAGSSTSGCAVRGGRPDRLGVFLVHGEAAAQDAFAAELGADGFAVTVPDPHGTYEF